MNRIAKSQENECFVVSFSFQSHDAFFFYKRVIIIASAKIIEIFFNANMPSDPDTIGETSTHTKQTHTHAKCERTAYSYNQSVFLCHQRQLVTNLIRNVIVVSFSKSLCLFPSRLTFIFLYNTTFFASHSRVSAMTFISFPFYAFSKSQNTLIFMM